jgi:hypothetical protein
MLINDNDKKCVDTGRCGVKPTLPEVLLGGLSWAFLHHKTPFLGFSSTIPSAEPGLRLLASTTFDPIMYPFIHLLFLTSVSLNNINKTNLANKYYIYEIFAFDHTNNFVFEALWSLL